MERKTRVLLLIVWVILGVSVSGGGFKYGEGKIPTLNVPKMVVAPKIDGTIGEKEWQDSVKVMGMVSTGSLSYKDRPVSFWVAWDDEHLYIAARSDILPGHRMWRQRREKFTTGVVFDDSYEFGIFMHDRNKLPEEVSSFQKIVLNSLGAGEYMKIYPSIGQNMYNWQPTPEIANRIYKENGKEWWAMEMALDLKDLQLPSKNKVGDEVGMLLAADLKNPGWQWLDFPSATGHLEHYGFSRMTLTEKQPYIQVENFSGLHDEKIDFRSVIYNPGKKPVTVYAKCQINYNPPSKGKLNPRELLNETKGITIPAGESAQFDISKAFPGLKYEKTKWGHYINSCDLRLEIRKANDEELAPVYTYDCQFAGTGKGYLKAKPRTTPFDCGVRFNPSSNIIDIFGDTLDAKIPKGTKADKLKYTIMLDGKTVQEDFLTLYVNYKYEGLVPLKDPKPGKYKVKLALVDKGGKELVARDDLSFEKKDEASVFKQWWNNKIGNTEKVLKPFSAIKVDGDKASVTRRTYQLGALGLPRQIESNKGNVLTAPARIVVTVAGKEHIVPTSGSVTYTSKKDWRTEFTGQAAVAGITFSVKGWMEQDGLVNLDLTYQPTGKAVSIEDFRVEWPIDDTYGSWMQCIGGVGGNYAPRTIGKVPDGKGVVWDCLTDIGKAGSKMIIGNWENNLWVGNDQRGLCWFGNNDKGWVPSDKTPAHSLFRDGKSVIIRNHIINIPKGGKPFALDKPRTINLQYNATPFRHLAKGWRLNQVAACNGFSSKTWKYDEDDKKEYFTILSMPSKDPKKWPYYLEKYKKIAAAKSKSGWYSIRNRLSTHLCNQIALRGYAEKTREPGMYNYFRADWASNFDGETLNKTYRDYMLYLMNMHVRDGGLEHYYFDISFTRSTPALAAGFGYRLPDGRVQPGSMDRTLREWYKRVWALMQEHDKYPGGVSGHATHSMPLKAMPWTDSMLDAEYPIRDAMTVYTKDAMIAMSVPHNFGVKIDHHGHMKPTWPSMFDAGMGGSGGILSTPQFRHFGISASDVEFLGFWRNGKKIKPADKGVLVSAWKRPGKLLMQVLNYGLDPEDKQQTRSIKMKLDLKALEIPDGLEPGQIRIRELPIGDNRVDGRDHIFGWYKHLLYKPRWRNDKNPYIRPAANPQISVNGIIDNGQVFYHDSRFFEVTWDEKPVDRAVLTETFGLDNLDKALQWGISRAQPANGKVKVVDGSVTVKTWRQPGTAMMLVTNTSDKPVKATLQADLDALGVKVTKRWVQFTQCLGGKLDAVSGKITIDALKPGEARLVFIDTFSN